MQPIQYLNNARLATLLHRYKELNIKKMLQKSKIFYNNECLRLNLLPSYARGRLRELNFNATKAKQVKILGRSIIRDEIRKLYQHIYTIDLQLKTIYNSLHRRMTALEFDECMRDLHGTINFHRSRQYRKLHDKIKKLKFITHRVNNNIILSNQSVFSQLNNDQLVVDSNIFSNNELSLLQKGFKFNPPQSSKKQQLRNLELLGVESESILQSIPLENTEEIRSSLKVLLKKEKEAICNNRKGYHRNPLNEYKDTIKSIDKKISENNLTVTKADKGSTVVVLHTQDYHQKVTNFILDNQFLTKSVNINTFTTKVRTAINKITEVFDNTTKKKLLPSKANVPRLYGLMKIHKTDVFENIPIRPVVSFTDSPTHALASHLNKFLKTFYNNKFDYVVSNNLSLTNKITEVNLSDLTPLQDMSYLDTVVLCPLGPLVVVCAVGGGGALLGGCCWAEQSEEKVGSTVLFRIFDLKQIINTCKILSFNES
ncbi:uncharacterized protein LOC126883415 [Diabrotica virgifera virgifera]|uniref:Uncharacterized protein n=1 Tax=Diabrotica virgifera virgifera TaxID=50390 RepID=A0ABM5K3Z8_DIAVI|nr:uncharacterized protein LOC126883415 [Diabrotica virgifera virgifera]